MTTAPSLDSNMSLTLLRRHVRFTIARLRTRSWGKSWLALFEAEQKNLDTALQAEARLSDAVEDAEADLDAADAALDSLVRHLGLVVKQLYRGKDRDDMLQTLFGPASPSRFAEPLLGEQLDAMAKWPEVLKGLSYPSMSDQAPKVEAAVKQARAALDVLVKAEAPLLAFRVGVRQPLIKKIDGLRQQLQGEARKQARDSGDPEEAEGLFLRRLRRRPPAPTLARARAELAECEQAVVAAKQQLVALEEAERVAEQRRTDRRAGEDRLAGMLRQQAELQASINELRSSLNPEHS
ncbi:MAG: hypothetical protein U1A78_04840 [Polyangia bacterium]